MITDAKYQVMAELLGVLPGAIEKAEEHAKAICDLFGSTGHKMTEDEIMDCIHQMRAEKKSWREIGEALEITGSAAEGRYRGWQAKQQAASPPNLEYLTDLEKIYDNLSGGEKNVIELNSADSKIRDMCNKGVFPSSIAESLDRTHPGEGWTTKKVAGRIKELKAKGLI